jgi:hypothetical protein
MSTGFNSNVEVRGAVYHVQTEDRGLQHPFVDTVVLSGGRVVYRRSVGYQDLLTANAVDEAVLGARIDQQHREILEGVRDGSLPLDESKPAAVAVRLCNPTSWLVAGQASLEVEVLSRPERRPVAGADVQVSIEGAGDGETSQFASQTSADGRARLRFRMPALSDHPNPALVIRVSGAVAGDQVRYRLKPKRPDSVPRSR